MRRFAAILFLLVFAVPPSFGGQGMGPGPGLGRAGAAYLATDDFNRADNTNLGTNWAGNNTSRQTPQISSNRLVHASTAAPRIVQWVGVSAKTDQCVSAKVAVLDDQWLVVRAQTPTTSENFYGVDFDANGAYVFKWVSGSYTQFGADITDTISASDNLAVCIVGQRITYYRNGVSKGYRDADSTFTSGVGGIGTFGTSSAWDDFKWWVP